MAASKDSAIIESYASDNFNKALRIINKDKDTAIGILSQNLSKIKSIAIPISTKGVSEYAKNKASCEKAYKAFMQEMNAVWSKKAKSGKKLDTLYDNYCQTIAELEAENDRWTAVLGADFILKVSSGLQQLLKMREMMKLRASELLTEIEALKKDLKKAEKEEWHTYVKNGISICWSVATMVIPPLRAMSMVHKLAATGLIVLSSDAIFGSKSDIAEDGTTTALDGMKIASVAKKMERAATGFGAASLALKAVVIHGDAKEVAEVRSKVEVLKAKIDNAQKSVNYMSKTLRKTEGEAIKIKTSLRQLEKKMMAQVQKGRDASKMHKSLLAKRAKP
ncbi:hypothetical protein [Neptunicoccus cionae]|uniref:hypothetical protein n=1 Tax=Neptunicoccus cionae TaxID=2035344 RepID=UPI000C76CA31|nr:hypothetical protein [Amylibacter cionae]PLS21976.1 hypothetical protein C0U40_05920 [Amylibacter cionae]